MTWVIHMDGHFQPWDEAAERKVAEVGRKIVEELREYGINAANFNGNFYHEDYLTKFAFKSPSIELPPEQPA